MNKTERNITKLAKVNPETGLTSQQEQCASLLAAGERVSVVAEKVNVSRTTIYQWHDLLTFQCFLNQLRDEVKKHMNQSLLSLTGEAISVLRQSLASENEGKRLKSAMWLLDKMSKEEVGTCNPFSAIKEQATFADGWGFEDMSPRFHQQVYENKLKELGLQDPTNPTGRKKRTKASYEEEDGWEIGGD